MARRRTDPGIDGVAVIDKPAGWTSHDVVAKSRGIIGTRKIGHSGTLDPDATGVLVLGVGKATRLLRFMTELPKSYVGEIVFGVETNTLDASGEVTAVHEMSDVSDADVRQAALGLTGPIMQIPPMVSAVKIGGRRLHELAREGKEIDRPPRPVTIHRFDLDPLSDQPSVWRCEVDCSSGTYIRTLAADLGTALGGGAHLRNLRRTAVGGFTLADAHPMETPELLPIESAVRHLGSVTVTDEVAIEVGHGRVLPLERLGASGAGPWAVLNSSQELLAVYEANPRGVKPTLVIPR